MASIKENNLELNYGWPYGESGWNSGMDENIVKLGFESRKRINGILSSPPSSPSNGDAYIVGTAPTGLFSGKFANIAIYDRGSWVFITPKSQEVVFNTSDGCDYIYNNGWSLKLEAEVSPYIKIKDFTFSTGYTITDQKQCLLNITDNHYYQWNGTLPKVVSAGSTPATSGGIGAGAWVDRTDVTLRTELSDKGTTYSNVLFHGLVGDGVTDETAATQALFDAGIKYLEFPSGKHYYFAGTLKCPDGFKIKGYSASGSFYTDGTHLICGGACIFGRDTATVDSVQYTSAEFDGLTITGGVNPIDLGLTHGLSIHNTTIGEFAGYAVAVTKGERFSFKNFFLRNNATNGLGCFGFRKENSIYSSQLSGISDGYADRISMDTVLMLSANGTNGGMDYFVDAKILSGLVTKNVGMFGGRKYGIKATDVIQFSDIDLITDGVGTFNSTTALSLIESPIYNEVVLRNIDDSNCAKSKGVVIGQSYRTTAINCILHGDNSTAFGFYLSNHGAYQDQLFFINCAGAYYNTQVSDSYQRHIGMINCRWSYNNSVTKIGSSIQAFENQNSNIHHSARLNGVDASSGVFEVTFDYGSGGLSKPFFIDKDRVWVSSPNGTAGRINFTNIFGTGNPNSIIMGTRGVMPEGNVTAVAGSLYMYHDSSNNGVLYVKQSGNGNTGWVAK